MKTLAPPNPITDRYAVVIWDRDEELFILALPSGSTYELGDIVAAKSYLASAMSSDLAEGALDMASNFGAAQVIPHLRRVIQADLGPELKELLICRDLLKEREAELFAEQMNGSASCPIV